MAATTSRWCPRAINETWRHRTLRILVQPTPITFAERRSVLQVLQQKGDIEVFRQERSSKSNFIAVTRTEETASRLLEQEAVSYNVSVPSSMPDITFKDLANPNNVDGTKGHIHQGQAQQELDDEGRVHKNFTVRFSGNFSGPGWSAPSGLYYHSGIFNGSPLHGAWPESYTRDETMMSSILKESLPPNMTAKGFARWDYDLEDRGVVSKKAERLEQTACLPSRMPGPNSGAASVVEADEKSTNNGSG